MRRLTPYILTIFLICFATPMFAQQRSVEAQKKIIAAIEQQIKAGVRALTSIRKDKSATENRVRSLAKQVEQRNRLLSEQQRQISLLSADIDSIALRTTELHSELDTLQVVYAEMVREAYRNYHHNNFVSYIFASDNFKEVARRVVNIRQVAQLRKARITSIDSLSTSLNETRELLLERKAAMDSTVMNIKSQKSKIQRDINSARSDIKKMSSKERTALQNKAMQEQKLDTAIAELRKLSKGNSTGASFSTRTSHLNLPVSSGRVKRYMDNMAEVVGSKGASVISIYDGKVVEIKQNRITGKYDIYIAHGEYITSYAGLKSVAVNKNQTVYKNQKIGEVGAAIDVITMNTEYKIIFGIYPPSPTQKMKASDCFKK